MPEQEKTDSQERKSEAEVSSKIDDVQAVERQSGGKHEQTKAAQPHPQRPKDIAAWGMLIATWLMLLVTASLVWIARGHWRATQDTNELTRQSLKSARETLQIMERAVLSVEGAKVEMTAQEPVKAQFIVRNIGRSPGQYRSFQARVYTTNPAEDIGAPQDEMVGATIGPTRSKRSWVRFTRPVSELALQKIVSGEKILIFDGRIFYSDLFGSQEVEYFCFVHRPDRETMTYCTESQANPF